MTDIRAERPPEAVQGPSGDVQGVPKCVGELLAVMNRDGGHFLAENGLEAACKRATERYYEVLGQIDGPNDLTTALARVHAASSIHDARHIVVQTLGAHILETLQPAPTAPVAPRQDAPHEYSEADISALRRDAERLDWLETQVVEVRTPTRYGSQFRFAIGPDWEETRSDFRAAIDTARATPK